MNDIKRAEKVLRQAKKVARGTSDHEFRPYVDNPEYRHDMWGRAVGALRQAKQALATWTQTPDYEPEQWVKSHPSGRSVMVEHLPDEDEERPWTWQHFDTDVDSAGYPSAWGRLPTRYDAIKAADIALEHPLGEGPWTWTDMRHLGWDPRDQGNPRTYQGDPALRSDAPDDPEEARRVLRPGKPYRPRKKSAFDGIDTKHLINETGDWDR